MASALNLMKRKLGGPQKPRPYSYRPLDTSKNEVRLIYGLPSQEHHQLQCSLIHVSLDEAPEYWALSYAWKEPRLFSEAELSSSTALLVDGARLDIGVNLASFFRTTGILNTGATSFWKDSNPFWIDAICINQDDVGERGAQVLRMQSIYTRADSVFVWLGPSAQNSKLALEWMASYNKQFQESKADWVAKFGSDRTHEWIQRWQHSVFLQQRKSLKTDGLDPAIKAVIVLLRRAWWSRTWVVQEILCAAKVWVLCGNDIAEWQFITTAVEGLLSNWEQFVNALEYGKDPIDRWTINQATNMEYLRCQKACGTELDYLQVLYATLGTSSTDPRDKIFGTIGLITDPHVYIHKPDYSKSARKLYKEIALALLLRVESLDVLCFAGYPRGPLSLPSWCPDWTSNVQGYSQVPNPLNDVVYRPRQDGVGFCAAFGTALSVRFFAAPHNLDRIVLCGFRIDIVDGLGHAGQERDDVADEILQPRHQETRYTTEEDTFEAIWQTIVGGVAIPDEFTDFGACPPAFGTIFARQCVICEEASHHPPNDIDSLKESFENEVFSKWYLRNRDFRCNGKSIRSWTQVPKFSLMNDEFLAQPSEHPYWRSFHLNFGRVRGGRRLVTTRKGYVCLVPDETRLGDQVCIFRGGRMPLIMRRVLDHYLFVGEAYVHGIMFGEAMEELERGEYEWENFEVR